jgi:AcrR family transcriptional regulator
MPKQSANKPITRAPLTKETVIVAAVKLADAGGIESLSMRKLGQALGVEGMALYHHFANKEALIDGMVDSVHAEVKVPTDNQEWQAAMHERAVSAVQAAARHPWSAALIESRANPGVASMQLIDATVKCLLQAGFGIDMVAHVISVLDAYTFGFAQQLRSPSDNIEQEAQMGQDILAQFPFDRYPYVGQLITEHVAKAGYRSMDEFEFGLELILDGVGRFKTGE